MAHLKQGGVVLLALACLGSWGEAWGRQNIVIGEISVGYDFQERTYDDNDVDTIQGGMQTGGTNNVVVLTPSSYLNETNEGDTRSLFVTPRIRFSSNDVADLFAFTYAPTFTYDDIDSSNDVGHDLQLLGERRITKDWLVRTTDSYFYGDDPQSDYRRQGEAIVTTAEVQPDAQPVGADQEEAIGRELTDEYGRSKYWRNDFGLLTEYTYAQDSVIGLGYNYGVLRGVDDDDEGGGDYDDYDRHEAMGNLSYRFNTQWSAETELAYVRGLYDKTEITVVQPTTVTAANPVTTAAVDDDLVEYHGQLRLNYAWRPHDIYFGQYVYAATDYDAELREDSAIHEATLGWEHDFSKQLRMTLSGGPTFVTYERSDNETGYNAYAGLVWDFLHAALSANTSYRYNYENFDGQRSGLSKIWRSQLGCTYRFSPQWQAVLAAGYTQQDSEEPINDQIVVVADNASAAAADLAGQNNDHFRYREDTYDGNLTLQYNFLQWYTASLSYRYADFQSEQEQDYDEHRVMLTLTAAKEIFRW